jgi:hypothetical protein
LLLLKWPILHNFNWFAFWDFGAYLVTHYLLRLGYLPVTDFGWQYGLLPLLLQELWFHFMAASPASMVVLSIPVALLFTIAIARFTNLESRAAGHALMLISFPIIVPLLVDLPQALEPALLAVGLLLQARGKRAQSLAFATAACFTKPSMAYLYGLVLLIFIVVDLHRRDRISIASLARALRPAVLTGLGLTLLLGITDGWIALFSSLLPLAGSQVYRALHFGWSGALLGWFYFPGVRPAYYLGTPIAFWLLSTFYLIGALVLTGWRILQNRIPAPGNYEIVLTCALLHLGFVALFYGSAASWIYYAYILVMGVVATDAWSPHLARVVWGLCALAVIGNYAALKSSILDWKTMKQSSVTAGLFALPAESAEWEQVTSVVKGKNPALFTWTGGAAVLFPWLRKPVAAPMVPGLATRREIHDEVQELRSANAVIVPTLEFGNPITNWPGPEFQNVLDNSKLVFKGVYFEVYERATSSGGTGGQVRGSGSRRLIGTLFRQRMPNQGIEAGWTDDVCYFERSTYPQLTPEVWVSGY